MTWQPIRPDDGPPVYPDTPFRVTLDTPDGQYAKGCQTWLGVFRTVALFTVDGDHIHVRPIKAEDIVEIAIRYRTKLTGDRPKDLSISVRGGGPVYAAH